MNKPSIKDYEYTFESQGTSFIFEDLVDEFYDPIEAVSFSKDDVKSCYLSKQQIQRMNQEGMNMSVATLSGIVNELDTLVQDAISSAKEFARIENFTRDHAETMFKVLANACRLYLTFDYSYWDETFKASVADPIAAEKVEIVQNFKNKIREDLDPVYFTPGGYLPTLLGQLTQTLSISMEELVWYRYRDILALFDGVKVSADEINARKYMFAHYKDYDGIVYFYSGKDAEQFKSEFFGEQNNKSAATNIFTGKVAHSTGNIITGKVRVIVRDYGNPKAMDEIMQAMESGEIVVSQTTDPSLMPALRKAAAIITDVGGLLSHAAITARELNIPCIVDTKNASKVLKDGDMVEVDAATGIVRII